MRSDQPAPEADDQQIAAGRAECEYAPEPNHGGADTPAPVAADSGDLYERARTICLTQLSFAARSRRDLAAVLAKRGIPEDVATDVLDRYEELGLLNDAEYAAAWARSRHRSKGLSARAIRRELEGKGIAAEDCDAALEEVDEESERQVAIDVVRKKARALGTLDPAVKTRRLVALLARKGYSPGLSYSVVREVLGDSGADAAFETGP